MRILFTAILAAFAWVSMTMEPGVAAEEQSPAQHTHSDWPPRDRSVQIIVSSPSTAGKGDVVAKLVADQLSSRLGGQFLIENHSGANGNIAAGLVATAPGDGSRLLFAWAGTLAVNPSLYKKLDFDSQTSFEPIGLVAEAPNILVVSNEMPVDSLQEFTNYVQAYPGVVNFASSGNGSSMHLAGQLYMNDTHTNMVHVPYSAPGLALTNLISGEIQSMYQLIPDILAQIKAGQVKPLAVMSARRSETLPDVPTMPELGHPGLISSSWFALLAPKGTPADIIERANKALNEILQDDGVRQTLIAMGIVPLGGPPQDVNTLLASELEKWRSVVLDTNIRPQ